MAGIFVFSQLGKRNGTANGLRNRAFKGSNPLVDTSAVLKIEGSENIGVEKSGFSHSPWKRVCAGSNPVSYTE